MPVCTCRLPNTGPVPGIPLNQMYYSTGHQCRGSNLMTGGECKSWQWLFWVGLCGWMGKQWIQSHLLLLDVIALRCFNQQMSDYKPLSAELLAMTPWWYSYIYISNSLTVWTLTCAALLGFRNLRDKWKSRMWHFYSFCFLNCSESNFL